MAQFQPFYEKVKLSLFPFYVGGNVPKTFSVKLKLFSDPYLFLFLLQICVAAGVKIAFYWFHAV